jgi:hypothetical protein
MKQSVNFNDFVNAFHAHDRYDQFGYSALQIIFDYLEQYEDETGQEIEIDVLAICCDYTVDTVEDIVSNYSIDIDGLDDEDEIKSAVIKYLQYNTSYLGETDDGQLVYQCF